MISDEQRYRVYHETGRAVHEDRAFLVRIATERFTEVQARRRTCAWIRDGRRSHNDLKQLARRWNVQLPTVERLGR